VRIAVIGLGRMGRFYAQTVASFGPPVRLAAVADPDPAARASVQAALGRDVPAFSDPAAVFQQADLDAVIVATTTSTHAEVVAAAAAAGKAIFSEKPLALSVEQTRSVLAAVDRAGVLLQVGFMRRFDPAYTRAKQVIETGQVGRPLTFRAVGRDPACPPLDYADPGHSGGLIVDMGIHDFDMARWLMSSEVERVSADSSVLVCSDLSSVGDADNAVVNLRFASGALGNVEVSRSASYGYDLRTEVLASDGAVRIGGTSADDVQILTPLAPTHDETPHFIRRFGAAYTAQIEHFVDCVQHQRTPRVGGADALAAITIAQAATRSAQTHRPVALADLDAAHV
jgi:inositol 2-dehydrogenase